MIRALIAVIRALIAVIRALIAVIRALIAVIRDFLRRVVGAPRPELPDHGDQGEAADQAKPRTQGMGGRRSGEPRKTTKAS